MRRRLALISALVLLAGSNAVPASQAQAVRSQPAAVTVPWLTEISSPQGDPQRAADAPIQLDVPGKDCIVSHSHRSRRRLDRSCGGAPEIVR